MFNAITTMSDVHALELIDMRLLPTHLRLEGINRESLESLVRLWTAGYPRLGRSQPFPQCLHHRQARERQQVTLIWAITGVHAPF